MKKLLEKLIEKLARWIARQNADADAARAAEQSAQGEGAATPAQASPASYPAESVPPPGASAGDDVSPSLLDWCWGGVRGGGARLDDRARIAGLRVSASGLSYRWTAGGCEDLGAASRDDYSRTVACLFCRVGGRWRGGKFDWVSTSRTSRDLKNVRAGYNGWRPDAIEAADAYALVIVSADGRRRTNIIMEARR